MELKELKKLIKYLRSQGITDFKDGQLELKLTPSTTKLKKNRIPEGQKDVTDETYVETSEPTVDELLFWSAGGSPELKDS